MDQQISEFTSKVVSGIVIEVFKSGLKGLSSAASKGSIIEQKSFLRSFIKRIEVSPPNILIEYTIPLKMEKVEPLTKEVLPIAFSSSGGRT